MAIFNREVQLPEVHAVGWVHRPHELRAPLKISKFSIFGEGNDGSKCAMSSIVPPGKLTSPWKITMFNGKIHYSYGHFS